MGMTLSQRVERWAASTRAQADIFAQRGNQADAQAHLLVAERVEAARKKAGANVAALRTLIRRLCADLGSGPDRMRFAALVMELGKFQ